MFLKKHSQPEWTPADRQRERLLLDYFAAETNLEEKAKAAIVRKGVIDLYPDGPDKDRAIKDFEAAQHSLLCAIGTVDGLRNDMRSYIAAHEKDFEAKRLSLCAEKIFQTDGVCPVDLCLGVLHGRPPYFLKTAHRLQMPCSRSSSV